MFLKRALKFVLVGCCIGMLLLPNVALSQDSNNDYGRKRRLDFRKPLWLKPFWLRGKS
jgi:hypothetical protein